MCQLQISGSLTLKSSDASSFHLSWAILSGASAAKYFRTKIRRCIDLKISEASWYEIEVEFEYTPSLMLPSHRRLNSHRGLGQVILALHADGAIGQFLSDTDVGKAPAKSKRNLTRRCWRNCQDKNDLWEHCPSRLRESSGLALM